MDKGPRSRPTDKGLSSPPELQGSDLGPNFLEDDLEATNHQKRVLFLQ